MSAGRVPYAGIASRAIALAVDVVLVNLIVLIGGAVLALAASLVGDVRFDTVQRVLAAGAWTATVSVYFVLFWSAYGQTPGMRLMDLRVTTASGGALSPGRAVLRLIGLALAIIPLFLGFVPVLIDDRRRALQDFLARTVVLYSGYPVPAVEPSAEPLPDPSAVGVGGGTAAG